MALIKIVFDTLEESLDQVLDQLTVQRGPAVSNKVWEPLIAGEEEIPADDVQPDPPPPPADDPPSTDPDPDPAKDDGPTQEELDKIKSEMGDSSSPSVDLDKDGVPWDERIHSGNKSIVKGTGLWQKRRSLPDGLYDTVTAELKAAASVPDAPPTGDSTPPAPPPTGNDSPVPAPPTDGAWDWNTLVKTLTKAIAAGETTKAAQDEVLKDMGISLFPLLSPRTELYDQFANALGLVHP